LRFRPLPVSVRMADARRRLTLQEPHGAIEALRAELIVPETAEQLGDHDVRSIGYVDIPHIAKDDLDAVVPFCGFSLLQPEGQIELPFSNVICTHVVKALTFLSTAYTFAFLPDLSSAASDLDTSGPRPAPTTMITLRISISLPCIGP